MAQAIDTIMNKLTEVFAELDTKVLENTKVWADGRIVALDEYRKSEQYQEDRKTQSQYQKMFDIAGGYNVQCLHQRVLVKVK